MRRLLLLLVCLVGGCHFHLHTYETHKHGVVVEPDPPITELEITTDESPEVS